MARSGQLKGKVGDTELKGLLEQVSLNHTLEGLAANLPSDSLGICAVATSGLCIDGTSRIAHEGPRSRYHGKQRARPR